MESNHLNHYLKESVQIIVNVIQQRISDYPRPLVVSFDGGSGAGKSVLASKVASSINATTIQCDAFFNSKISDEDWDNYSLEKRCQLCIDWDRVRHEALLPLLAGKEATYQPFSFSTMNGF